MIDFVIDRCELSQIKDFVVKNHYSHNINGLKVSICFSLKYEGELVGAAIFGEMSTTAWKKFGNNEKDVLELRRLVLIDDTPRNSESWFISRMIKFLKKHTAYKILVSYADPNYGHTGIIYRASNFIFEGMSGKDVAFKDKENSKIYHSRALRTKYKGEFKPFVKKLREKLINGQLEKIELKPKYCYTFKLK